MSPPVFFSSRGEDYHQRTVLCPFPSYLCAKPLDRFRSESATPLGCYLSMVTMARLPQDTSRSRCSGCSDAQLAESSRTCCNSRRHGCRVFFFFSLSLSLFSLLSSLFSSLPLVRFCSPYFFRSKSPINLALLLTYSFLDVS